MNTGYAAGGLLALLVAAAAGSTLHAASGPTKIPFTLFHDNIVVDVELTPDHHLPFVFDSGLSVGNVLTTETADELGLESKGKAHFTDAGGGHGSTEVTDLPSIAVGGVQLHDQKFAITKVPASMKTRPDQAPIAGFLGAPLMQDAVLCIDYKQKVLQRWAPDEFDSTGLASIPIRLNHELATIRINVDGVTANVVVDTGNDGGVELFPAFANAHNLRERYPDLEVRQAQSGNGRTFNILSGTANEVGVGPDVTLKQVPLLFIAQAFDPDWGIDGFVGYKFLSLLNPCLNRDGGKLFWAAAQTNQK